MRRMALVAYFVSVVISSACASSDEFGWWRVKDVPVPDVEFQDDSPPLRALPVPDGTVNMDLGLALGLPATTFEHIAELARGLDYNPDNCYRYVRNNIAYASYYGLLRGPERTLVDRAVYQAMVDEWGSPLRRLSAYGESPMVADPEIVNAVWDLGAAVTAYRNLGGKLGTPIGKLETGKITPDRFKRIPNNLPEELT